MLRTYFDTPFCENDLSIYLTSFNVIQFDLYVIEVVYLLYLYLKYKNMTNARVNNREETVHKTTQVTSHVQTYHAYPHIQTPYPLQ